MTYKEFKETNEQIKNNNLNYKYIQLMNEHTELFEKNFSFDELVRINSLLKLSEGMSPSRRLKFAKTIINYYQAEIAYKEMKEVSKLIDDFMNDNNITSDTSDKLISSIDIKRRINSIPESRLVLTNQEEKEKIYEEYGKKFYEFALYLNYKNEAIFTQEQINFIDKYAKEDINKILIDNDMPADLHKVIQESHQNRNYHDRELLKHLYLYKYKNEILVSTYPKDLNTKLNEIVNTQGKIVASKSRIRKFIARTALVTTLTIGTMLFIPTIVYAVENNNPYWKTATFDIDDKTIEENAEDLLLYKTILKEYYNTTRKYVTVFGETQSDKVNVKVYDYTNTNYTDEELKNIELDENNIIFDDMVSVYRLERRTSVYGEYTGKSHRDITSVKFNKVENHPLGEALIAFLAESFVVTLVALTYLGSDDAIREKLENIIRDIKEEKKSVEDLTQELLKLVEEAEAIEAKYSVDNTTVDQELENIELGKRV